MANNIQLRILLRLGLLAEAFLFLYSYFSSAAWPITFQLSARYSGRLSLFFFLGVFILTSKNWKERRAGFKTEFAGLLNIFALLHFIHLLFLAANIYLNEIDAFSLKSLGGVFTYGLILTYPWFLKNRNPPLLFDNIYFYFVGLLMLLTLISRVSGANPDVSASVIHYIGLLFLAFAFVFHLLILKKKPGLQS